MYRRIAWTKQAFACDSFTGKKSAEASQNTFAYRKDLPRALPQEQWRAANPHSTPVLPACAAARSCVAATLARDSLQAHGGNLRATFIKAFGCNPDELELLASPTSQAQASWS